MGVVENILSLPAEVKFVFSFLIAFFITFISIPSIVTVAQMKHLVDIPNNRTSHKENTPTLGGIGIFAGFVISISICNEFVRINYLPLLLAGILIVFFIGLKDDILIIACIKKLLGEIVAALLITMVADIRITHFHGFLGIEDVGYIQSILFSVFVIVLIINGFNMIDGIDGLAGGVGFLTSLTFGVMFYRMGLQGETFLSFAMAGALLAFLWFNCVSRKKKIFMGDSGAFILGLVQAVLAIKVLEFEGNSSLNFYWGSTPAITFGILIIPLFDTLSVVMIRIAHGRSPFKADKEHIHHRLLDLGLSHLQASGLLIIVNLFFIGFSLSFQKLGVTRLSSLILLLAITLFLIPAMMLRSMKDTGKKIKDTRPTKLRKSFGREREKAKV